MQQKWRRLVRRELLLLRQCSCRSPLLLPIRNPCRRRRPGLSARTVYSHDGPIGRRKRGYILTMDQSPA
eukprot:740300-Prorocentrum_minimum.AAC.1